MLCDRKNAQIAFFSTLVIDSAHVSAIDRMKLLPISSDKWERGLSGTKLGTKAISEFT